jgi:hypothetical protein
MFAHTQNSRRFGMVLATIASLALVAGGRAAWPEEDDLKASPGSSEDGVGHAVGIDGEFAVVGAPTTPWEDGPGCAYVFQRSGTTWTQVATLTVTGGANGDDFGAAVAISGDVVVVGAPTTYAVGGAGTAYVYVKPAGGWAGTGTPTATLRGSDTVAPDHFGCAVAIDGDLIVAGAWGDRFSTPEGFAAGAAYVFVKPVTGWDSTNQQDAKLTASDRQAGDCLGFSVSISGDVILLGNYCDGDYGAGNAYLYVKPVTGWTSMTETATLDVWSSVDWDQFGYSVSLSGDYALVGVPGYDGVSQRDGCAYLFEKPLGGWSGTITTATAKLTASDAAYNDFFGRSVSIDGDCAMVGAPEEMAGETGSAYIFEKPSSGWATGTETQKVVGSDSHADRDEFGCAVALSGADAIVGAHYWEPDPNAAGNQNYGAAYVFRWTASGGCPGDVDGDGDVDLADLARLLAAYGTSAGDPGYDPAADLDGDGDVDLADLAILLSVYGQTCAPPLGACCVEGQCIDTLPFEDCAALLGEWFPDEDCFGDPPFACSGGLENDDCFDALPIMEVLELPFDTSAATFDGAGQCMSSPNIWYCFTPAVDGMVYVATCGSGYDTMLAVYDGCWCDPLPPLLECNDDSCGLQSEIVFPAIAGQEYLIEVGGYSTQSGPGVLTVMYQ